LADFFSRAFPQTLETKLTGPSIEPSEKGCIVASDAITIGTEHASHILIHFMRTIRVPEDGQEYSVPPGLKSFPLYDMQPFKSRLPTELATQGGIFLPMYREFNSSLRYKSSFSVLVPVSVC